MFDEFHWSRVCSESFLPQVYSLPYLCPKHPTHRRWIIPLGVWVVFLENYFNTYFCWVDGCRCCTCYLCESNPDPPPQIYLNNMPSFLLLFSPSLSPVWLFVTPWTAALQAFLFFTISQNLLKFMSIESVMLYNHLILCHPFLVLPSVFPSIRVSQLFASGGQSIGASALASVLQYWMSIQSWFPLGLTDLISLLSKGPSRVFSSTTVQKH